MSRTIGPNDSLSWRSHPGAEVRRTSARTLRDLIVSGQVDEGALVALDERSWQPISAVLYLADAFDIPLERRRRQRPAEEVEVDLAPMIDVTFLLLLFFMITATYQKVKTIDTPPPPQEGVTARPTLEQLQEENLIARIDAAGTLQLDDETVAWDQLSSELERRVRERQTARLIIVADDDTDWEQVVRLQDEANLAGIEKVFFGKGVPPGQ